MNWGSLIAAVFAVNAYDNAKVNLKKPEVRADTRRVMKFILLPLAVLIIVMHFSQLAFGDTFRNSNGQVTGRSTTNSVGTQYYDASGRNVGRSTTNSTGTTFYDNMGRVQGRSTPK